MHVTIVLPTFNRAYCLERAVRSVVRQTWSDWELLVVDDGSTDNTEELCHRLKAEIGHRFDYVKVANGGVSRARNIGVFRSSGDYIAFLDSDDYFYPEKLAVQMALLLRFDDVALCFANWSTFYDDGPGCPHQAMPAPFTGRIYPSLLSIARNYIVTPSVVAKREALMRTSMFDPTMEICEDIDLWRRVTRGGRALKIDTPLVGVHLRHSAAFPYLVSLRGRLKLYDKAHGEDRSLPPDLLPFLFREMFQVYAEVAEHRGDRAEGNALRHARRSVADESDCAALTAICHTVIASIEQERVAV